MVALALGPVWATPLFAATLAVWVVRRGAPAASRHAREARIRLLPLPAAEDAPLVALLHGMAESHDEDYLRVQAALADIRARANAAGPDAWSPPEPTEPRGGAPIAL